MHGSDDRDPVSEGDASRRLYEELERVLAENAELRTQLDRASAARASGAPVAPVATAVPRRWKGRLMSALILVVGFLLGLWYTAYANRDFVAAVAKGMNEAHREAEARRTAAGDGPASALPARAAVPAARP